MPRRIHEWAWGQIGQRTVCGKLPAGLDVAADLGRFDLGRRCQNCNRLRAAFGASSSPVLGEPPAPGAPPVAPTDVTAREREIMVHATAWQSRWPLYRNHYCTSEGGDDWSTVQRLVARGLMRESRKPSELSGGDNVFCVTALGIATLKSGWVESGETERECQG